MTVITISREWGSDGTAIAQRVAEEMGYRFVTKNTFEKILQQYGLVQLHKLYESVPGLWARLDNANLQLVSMLNKIILGIAHLDNVVMLGRGGYAALSDYADILHIRIQAPFSLRVKRVMEREKWTDVAKANKMVATNDKSRAQFVQGFYDADYHNARQFHLVLDTAVIPADTAVRWIVEAARLMANRSVEEALVTQAIDVDPILADAIAQVIMPVWN
ncbi:MAG: cytidylate kinase-like family protein [Anaerolineales bacterium]|nr:cytidylate kinase-like family protein [Anaerolineales bacterium]